MTPREALADSLAEFESESLAVVRMPSTMFTRMAERLHDGLRQRGFEIKQIEEE